VNTVTGHRGGEPVTFITAKQELILGAAVPHHQHKMARSRPDIQNLGNNPVLTANIEEFAIAIPANINSDLLSLPRTRPLNFHPCAHAGEVPTQILCGRHMLLSLFVGLTNLDAGEGDRSHLAPRRNRGN
jgi:hypothetical protein